MGELLMSALDLFRLLQTLTETPGPSGYEAEMAAAVREAWEPYVDSCSVDWVGNLVAVKEGQGATDGGRRRRLLLAAHMDEIGLMVKQIVAHPDDEGSGFLRVTGVGGVDIRHLYGQLVTVHGSRHGRQQLAAVLGSLPAAMLPPKRRDKPFGFEELVADTGLPAAELRQRVAVGDLITFHQPLRRLLNKRVSGKALDNRASLAAMAVCLDYLRGRHHQWDVVAVATAQEETRLLGAFTSAYSQMPDAAVALDVTFGKGPGATDATTFELNGGPLIGLGPNVHPGMFAALKEAAAALEMKATTDPHAARSGTDAFGLQIARDGIPTGLVSIPLRYMHTMVESVALNDVERAGRLLGEFVARLDDDFIDKLTAGLME
jgi:tetrahedral aminopeptidase